MAGAMTGIVADPTVALEAAGAAGCAHAGPAPGVHRSRTSPPWSAPARRSSGSSAGPGAGPRGPGARASRPDDPAGSEPVGADPSGSDRMRRLDDARWKVLLEGRESS